MDRLWSPWRLTYVTGASTSVKCVFCDAAATGPVAMADDGAPDDLVVARGPLCYVLLNLYPYNNGHLLVVPKRHVGSLAESTADELAELISFTRIAEMALQEAYQPQGINVGLNLGRAAGAGIVDHLHVHLVPRWIGDTNAMTVIGETRVLPETLDQVAERLRPVFERLQRGVRS